MTLVDCAFFACLLMFAAGLGLVALAAFGLIVALGVGLAVFGAGSAWVIT